MIKVSGSIRRTFTFPAELPVAFAYYGDLGRLLPYLPRIFLVQAYSYDRFRLLYSTTELGMYHIHIFCDLCAQLDERQRTLCVTPFDNARSVDASAGPRTTSAQGLYSSKSVFYPGNGDTRIDYRLQLRADLPTPHGLRYMPNAVVNRIAQNITKWRMREIADGFIERSVDAFPYWLAEMKETGLCPE